MIVFEHWFAHTTPLNFTRFNMQNHQSPQWNVCAAHVNNFSSNFVKCIDFSDLSGATVGRSRFYE